jgi:energy-coupling factor transporter ATP-binding protein EcfA2
VTEVPTIRLFVSSPGDVMPERDRVDRVVRRLNAGLANAVTIEAVRWEHQYYTADSTFQTQIADSGTCDIVVSIFWQRLGTPLPDGFERMPNGQPYPSGTVYEVMKAIEAHQKSAQGLPDVLVYRKLADAVTPVTDRERYRLAHEQRLAFLNFWDQWFFTSEGQFKAAYNTFESTDEFEEKLEQHLRSWLTDRGYAARAVAWPIGEKGSPFRGLEAFGPADEEIFFGRERETARALERLGRAAARGCGFLLLVGESGSGKSSLARAGIVPKLMRGALPGRIASWRYAEARPGARVAAALAQALFAQDALPELARGDFNTPDALADLMASAGKAAAASVLRALERSGADLQQKISGDAPVEVGLVLLLDQLEALIGGADAELANVAAALGELARSGRVLVVATLRSDAYARLARVSGLVALKDGGETLDVATPEPAGIADIVRRPAQIAGLDFGRDQSSGQPLDETIIKAATGRDALPLVEFSLSRLYAQMLERLAGRGLAAAQARPGELVLAVEDYAAFGGFEGAVAEAAERAFAATPPPAQAALPRLLRALAQAVDAPAVTGQVGALRLIDVSLAEAAPDADAQALVRALVDARILVQGGGDAQRVRLAHEAVLRSWPRARAIVEANANFFRIRADVAAAEQRWRRHQAENGGRGTDAFLLAQGVPLAEAQDMRARFADELSAALLEFIDRSSARARRQVRRLMAASIVFALTAAGAVAAAGAAFVLRNQAAANATLAQKNAEAALKNFHGAADQAEALVVTLGGKLKYDPSITREALKTILAEGQSQIEALAAQDRDDHYVAQVRAKTLVNIADNFFDLGDIATAKSVLSTCMRDLRNRPREAWDFMDRHVASLCDETGSKLAAAEGKIDAALGMAEDALDLAGENAKGAYSPLAARNFTVVLIDVGDLLVRKGDLDTAQKRYQQALDLRRMMVKITDDQQMHDDLQLALDRIGKIADLRGNGADALAIYREALDDMLRAPPDGASASALRTENLSIAYAKVALVLARGGHDTEAIDNYRPSVDLRRQLVALDMSNWRWRTLLAQALQGLGLALARSGNADEGLPLLTDAIDRYRAIAQHDPQNAGSRHDVALALNTYAGAVMAKDRAAALTAAHESLALFRALAAGDAPTPGALLDVAAVLLTVADAGEDTRKNYTEALSIYRSLDQQGGALPPAIKTMLPSMQSYIDGLPTP